MHAITILHRILSVRLPEIHTKRLTSLLPAVEAVVMGSRLTLSDMGSGLIGKVAVKHNIKRIDRLLGNSALHSEVPQLYEVLVRQCLDGMSTANHGGQALHLTSIKNRFNPEMVKIMVRLDEDW